MLQLLQGQRMSKVFISGSMRIKNLTDDINLRLKYIIDSNLDVIVGDADGVDSAIQRFFLNQGYENINVYCTGDLPRNNLGSWPVKRIHSNAPPGTRAFFTAKDLAMSEDCNYGLMVWDTKSIGTLSNVLELLHSDKKSRVYVNKAKQFVTVSNVDDMRKLISFMNPHDLEKANDKIKLSEKIESIKYRNEELF